MGSVRTLLALAVVLTHAVGFVFVGGQLAVQMFYVISGFLMSFVLTETRTYSTVSKFYVNRFLRLYPTYWIVAAATLLLLTIKWAFVTKSGTFFPVYREIGPVGFWSLVLSNLLLFGQDWIMFLGVRGGTLQFVTDFQASEILVWKGLLVPQAWTLGVELTFYLIAPFVLRSRKLIYAALGASLLVRVYLFAVGLGENDPWTYRFFPAELAFFLAGALSHQTLRPLYSRLPPARLARLSSIATFAVFSYCAVFFLLPLRSLHTVLLLAVFISSLPLLFAFQARRGWDKRIGDLSYPIYISHMLFVSPLRRLVERTYAGDHPQLVLGVLTTVGALILGYVVERVISARIEALRARVKERAAGGWSREQAASPLEASDGGAA